MIRLLNLLILVRIIAMVVMILFWWLLAVKESVKDGSYHTNEDKVYADDNDE